LVFNKNDGEPYFAYGTCDRPTPGGRLARLNLDKIDPKLFSDAVATEKYIIVRWTDGRAPGDLFVDGLSLNESGGYLWSLSLAVDLKTLDQWRAASRLQLTLGVRESNGSGLKWRQSYVMPDDNRHRALATFIRSCSDGQPR
jgi:hypothetical protein